MNASSHDHRPVIALLTDFGISDGYIGVLKGVILDIAMDAQLIDITHTIAPQQVASGAWVLATSYQYFPANTIFLCVIDPGVGSSRLPIAIHAGQWFFVGPDNGLFSYILREQPVYEVVTLSNPSFQLPRISTTFHGRDIFAPTAAHLARGISLSELGPRVDPTTLQRLDISDAKRDNFTITGHVVHIDSYGNIITTISLSLIADLFSLPHVVMHFPLQKITVTQRRHFFSEQPSDDEQKDAPFLYIDSSGHLGVAINKGNAARSLHVNYNTPIILSLAEPGSE